MHNTQRSVQLTGARRPTPARTSPARHLQRAWQALELGLLQAQLAEHLGLNLAPVIGAQRLRGSRQAHVAVGAVVVGGMVR